jgi:glycosyltransferase involved in cell wall biosynthesis
MTGEMAPVVSVVIPNFRGGPLLREGVASVQAQTLKNWELIIVSDGCEEDLSDLEREDPRVRVFHQRNRGVSIARNVGIGHARSELIALLDDDDRMSPDRLLAQYEAMRDESIGLCHTQFRFIDENGKTIGIGESKDSQYLDFLRGDGSILLSSTMIRKKLIQEVGGFNPLLPLSQDLDLLYRIARETSVKFLPAILAEYRRHGANTWSDTSSGGDERKLILRQHRFAAEAHGETEIVRAICHGMTLIPSDRAARAMRHAREARSDRDYVELLRALGKAVLLSPLFTLRSGVRKVQRDVMRHRDGATRHGS